MDKTPKNRLTIKQQDFCLAYVQNKGNATQAYLTAYPGSVMWNIASVQASASDLMRNPLVEQTIASIRAKAEQRTAITTDRVLKEEASLAFHLPGELFNKKGLLIPIPDLPDRVQRAISSFKATEIWSVQRPCPHCNKYAHVGPKGGVKSVLLYKYEYKFWDKGKALERISRWLGLYEKDNQQKALALLQIVTAALPAPVGDKLLAIAEQKLLKMEAMPHLDTTIDVSAGK